MVIKLPVYGLFNDSPFRQNKENFMSEKKLFNAMNLNVEENKTISKIKDGIRSIVRCNHKPIIIDNSNYDGLLLNNKYIVFNTQSNVPDCSYWFLEKNIHEVLSTKISFIFCKLLEFIQNPELHNGIESQELKQLLSELIKKDLIDFNNYDDNNLLNIWIEISNTISQKCVQDGLISLKYKREQICIEDDKIIQQYREKLKIQDNVKCLFTSFDSNISVKFPILDLLKEKKNLLMGVTLEKNDIDILNIVYQFIFENINEKNVYCSLKDYKSESKDIDKIYIIDPIREIVTPSMLLIEKFNSVTKNIDGILDVISNIDGVDKSLIENEKFNLNLTKEEMNYLKSFNEYVPKHHFGSIQDLKNELKANPIIKFEEFNKQKNEAFNKISKQVPENKPKVQKRQTYSSLGRAFTQLSLITSIMLSQQVNILDPDDVSFNEMMPNKERIRHSYILGGSGSGKTSLIETLLYNDCQKLDESIIIFDLMGKATKSVLKFLKDPNRLLIIDPYLHSSITPVINPFEFFNEDGTINEHPSEIEIENRTNAIINASNIALKIKDGWSINMRAMLVPCLSTLLRKGGCSFEDLLKMMNDEINKDLVTLGKNSPIKGHRNFFRQEFYNESYEVTKRAISAKIQVFLNDPTFANLVTGKSTINLIKEINTRGKVIIFKLSAKQNLFARLMMEMIQDAMRERINISEDKIVPTHIYLDEFQNYLTPTIEEILSESRNYKFYVTFAHQSFVQLSKKMQGIVLSNSNIKIVGQCSYDNGKKMAKEIKTDFEMIESLDQGEFVFKVGANKVFKAKNTDKFINDKTPYHNKQRTRHMKHQFKNYYVYKDLTTSVENIEISDSTTLTPKCEEF